MAIPKSHSELQWFFNYSSPIQSNCLTLSSCLGTHSSDPEEHITISLLRNAKKEKYILHKLQQLTPAQRAILSSCFDHKYMWNRIYSYRKEDSQLINYPQSMKSLVKIFGKMTGAIFFNTYLSYEPLMQLYNKKINKKLSISDQQMAFQIGVEVKKLYSETIKAYEELS